MSSKLDFKRDSKATEGNLNKSRALNQSQIQRANSFDAPYEMSELDMKASIPPTDFHNFLPYACLQLSCKQVVVVKNIVQQHIATSKTKPGGRGKSTKNVTHHVSPEVVESLGQTASEIDPSAVVVQAIHNQHNQLIHIKLMKNKQVPRAIPQIINLIVKFHPYLEAITIDRGIDKYIIYEITKLQSLTSITELCFDNTYIAEANYYILLDDPHHLKNLSLSKCKLNDAIVEKIAERLVYPNPASKVLSLLNLSTNLITDKGARALARALRSNRQLCYLNLAGNMITDDGSNAIFDTMLPFSLTYEEMIASKSRYMQYLIKKTELINNYLDEYKTQKQLKPLKQAKVIAPLTKKNVPEQDLLYAKAEETVKMSIGEFTESFIVDVTGKNGVSYCNGNNTLAYINLCYNRLSSNSLSIMIKVFDHQNDLMRIPKGLVNINIEGNPMHYESAKNILAELNDLIEESFSMKRKKGK